MCSCFLTLLLSFSVAFGRCGRLRLIVTVLLLLRRRLSDFLTGVPNVICVDSVCCLGAVATWVR